MTDSVDAQGGSHPSDDAQSAFLRASTQDFLKRVGITSGMRVLDVGGDVAEMALLAAEMVGPAGEVIGVDRDEEAISSAAARTRAQGVTNVRFVHHELSQFTDLASDRPFDAVVSRLAMVYHPNPTETIRNLIRLVRPGGVVGFQDVELSARYWSTHKLETMEWLYNCVEQLAEENRVTKSMSVAYSTAFNEAGIVDRRIIRTGAAESASDAGVFARVGTFARRLVAGAGAEMYQANFGPSFEARLRSEVQSKGAVFIPFYWVGAAGRLPAPSAARSS